MPGGWKGSTWTPPENWSSLVRQVAERSGGFCERWSVSRNRLCGRPADGGVDHVKPVHQGGSDELKNLEHLCRWHHRAKTSAEGNAAKALNREAGRIEPPAHPGLRRRR